MTQQDQKEAQRRAQWLHDHKAPADWVVLTTAEVSALRREIEKVKADIAAVRKAADAYRRENDALKAELRAVKLFLESC